MKKSLRELRKKKGYTQRQVADILGIDQTTVSKWEHHESFPRVETLLALSELYDTPIDQIDLSRRPILLHPSK